MSDEEIHYINDPLINKLTAPENKLYRPNINFITAIQTVFFVFIGIVIISFIIEYIGIEFEFLQNEEEYITYFLYIYVTVQTIVLFLSLKFILIWCVKIYQKYANSETRLRCCYTPSCSEYAILALTKYGALIGTIKTIKRLIKCKPPGGIDYP